MINLVGLIIVVAFIIGLREEKRSFKEPEAVFKRCKIWGRLLIALVLLWGATGPLSQGRIFEDILSPLRWLRVPDDLLCLALYWVHEAGHAIFNLSHGPRFLSVFSGTLFQFGLPIGLAFYLVLKKGYFACGSIAIFTIGLSCSFTAPYIADARAQVLPMPPEPGIHDWNYMLSALGLLEYDQRFGAAFSAFAWVFIAGGLIFFVFSGTSSGFEVISFNEGRDISTE